MPKPNFASHNTEIEEIIRVDHAGEYGAQKIYEGQLKFIKNSQDKVLINSMLKQEKIHLDYFINKLEEYKIRPTILTPLWHVGGYMLGAISAIIGTKTAMLLTDAVEEVIAKHYQQQICYLKENIQLGGYSFNYTTDEKDLLLNIEKFQQDELEHQHIAILHSNKESFFTFPFVVIVKTICKAAIYISKKF